MTRKADDSGKRDQTIEEWIAEHDAVADSALAEMTRIADEAEAEDRNGLPPATGSSMASE